ncbi:MAG: glycosyltransferase [Gemmatimonadales bacterium]|nr:glycosyltransferase [Gemmatimonadales bacterium]
MHAAPPAPAVAASSAAPPTRRGRPVRVTFFVDSFEVGGTEVNAARTAEHLDPSRVALSVVHLHADGPLRRRYEALGVPLRHHAGGPLWHPRTWARVPGLARWLRAAGTDVLHCHDLYTNILGVPAARLAGVRGVIASRRWLDAAPRPGLHQLNGFSSRRADRVLANSRAVAGMSRDLDGIRADRIVTVSNFVDDGAFAPLPAAERAATLARLGVPAGVPVITCVARLAPPKDQRTLVLAAAALAREGRSCHVLLIGDGPQRAALSALAAECGIAAQVTFAGTLTARTNLHGLGDLSCLPTLSEGFPNAVVEAMAAGRPVVASDVGGVPDAIEPGVTGLLVPPADVDALAAALAGLLADPARAAALGAAAAVRARDRFSAPAVVGGLMAVYEALAA